LLINLCVRHLAVVDDIELTLKSGMMSLTGETGAGKSILVDALGLVLGDRADSNMIRQGHDRAEIEASFDVSQNKQLQQWLIQQELDDQELSTFVERFLEMAARVLISMAEVCP